MNLKHHAVSLHRILRPVAWRHNTLDVEFVGKQNCDAIYFHHTQSSKNHATRRWEGEKNQSGILFITND